MKHKYPLIFLLVFLCSFAICFSVYADDNIIYGCYKKKGGQLRIVGQGGRCLPSELAISWSQSAPISPAGLVGPPGPQGPAGPAGPAGPQGPSGTGASVPVSQIEPGACVNEYGWCPDGTKWDFKISDPIVSGSSVIEINIVNPSLYDYGCEVVTKAVGEFRMMCAYCVLSDAILQYAVFNP